MELVHTRKTLRISGYASLFGRRDLGGDIVRRGAFAASLLAMGETPLPMLYAHETKAPIGVWERLFEDSTGLFVAGRIFLGEARADRVARLVKAGALTGLSIGYRTLRARQGRDGRELLDLDLWEVSIVAFPMLRAARITQIDDDFPPQTFTLAQE
ncbi:MAG TPA: HK97 family phage prohead protease [Hellea balneolensis]|uniref:HK97 family phage prohead protease n=1 Tax=Hellea balneolensis TaxID=287478 RepID=A0A7V5NY82_9PROT|nr:HK97 family phage prohead protease [Hellea balneolensis]